MPMRLGSSRPGPLRSGLGATCSARGPAIAPGCRHRPGYSCGRSRKGGASMHDVVTIGETMLRLSALPGVPLEQAPQLDVHVAEIGRASCRERVEISVVAVSLK